MTDINATKGKGRQIVYVRSMDVDSLPEEVQAQTGGARQVYSIHNASGQCLALAQDRSQAFLMARQNQLSPVSVH